MLQHNKIQNFFQPKSDEKKLYIKVVVLDETHNFVVTFLFEIAYGPEFYLKLLYFKIQIFLIVQTTSNEKWAKAKLQISLWSTTL